MYQLDYENKRNRLTYNMIMEHFEAHVEGIEKLLDRVKSEGFERVFDFEIKNKYEDKKQFKQVEATQELIAEIDEFTGLTAFIDELKEHYDMPYWQRQKFDNFVVRRKEPGAPYQHINKHNLEQNEPIDHYQVNPYEKDPLEYIPEEKEY